MFVPLGIIGFSLFISVCIVNIRRIEAAIEARRKEAEAERKRKIRLANRGLTRNYYGLAKEIAEESDSSLSSDDNMDPRSLAYLAYEENEESEDEDEEENSGTAEGSQEEEKVGKSTEEPIEKPRAKTPGFGTKRQKWESEPKKLERAQLQEEEFEYVPLCKQR